MQTSRGKISKGGVMFCIICKEVHGYYMAAPTDKKGAKDD